MKKLLAIVLTLCMALACVSALAESTYHIFYLTEDLAGVTDNNGFISGIGATEYNSVVLKDDGTYEYTKLIGSIDAEGNVMESEAGTYVLRYVFTGTYTQDGDQVILAVPTECVFSEDWGPLVEMGYMKNSEGTASNGDRVSNYEGTDYDPMANFSTPVYKFAEEVTEVSITVNADGTFTYNAAASSDDD